MAYAMSFSKQFGRPVATRYDGSAAPTMSTVSILLAAIAWSWAWWVASIAFGGMDTAGGAITYLVGAFGPTIAVVTVWRRSTPEYRLAFRHRLLDWRVAPRWWLAGLILGAGPKLIGLAVVAIWGHEPTGQGTSVAEVPGSLLFSLLAVSIEEPLWRGVALDSAGNNIARASIVIGCAWAAWHIPLFAINGTFQEDELGLATMDFWMFLVGVVGLSVLITWMVVRSTGSILLAMFIHIVINMTGMLAPDDTTVRAIEMIVIILIGIVLFVRLPMTKEGRPSSTVANGGNAPLLHT